MFWYCCSPLKILMITKTACFTKITVCWSSLSYAMSLCFQDTNYAATTFNVTFGRHSLSHIDPNVFFEALMYGRADRESVALPIGE